jgi:hypothetical protein
LNFTLIYFWTEGASHKTLKKNRNFCDFSNFTHDAKEAKCHSVSALEKILEDEKKHIKMLTEEIKMRMEAGIFD